VTRSQGWFRPLVHNGAVTSSASEPTARPNGSTQRQHILNTALTLMAQQGVDGTSMRNLAAATGLNVASLYHYFPSKRDLLVAVLEERGLLGNLSPASRPALLQDPAPARLADLFDDILQSMLEVEDFIRLMIGEVMRGDQTAYAVGTDLFAATQELLEQWLAQHEPAVDPPGGQEALARLLRTLLVGLLLEHVTGVLDPVAGGDADAATEFRARAEEIAAIIDQVVGSAEGAS
jgi:AcrR family transcriptional regulator